MPSQGRNGLVQCPTSCAVPPPSVRSPRRGRVLVAGSARRRRACWPVGSPWRPPPRRRGRQRRRRRRSRPTGSSPPTAGSSPSAVRGFYGSTGGHDAQQAGRRHGRDARQRRVLAGGLRRRHLHLRRRPVLRLDRRPWRLNQPVVGMAADPDRPRATGWWPPTAGSSPSAPPSSTARWAASRSTSRSSAWPPRPTGDGYWLVAADGGIFAFGSAQFYGSTGGHHVEQADRRHDADPRRQGLLVHRRRRRGLRLRRRPVLRLARRRPPEAARSSAMASTPTGKGYWFTNTNGAVSAFGTATYWGSAPQVLNKPIVAMAEATGTGQFGGATYPSGSYGYDVSNYQCTSLPPTRTPSASSRWRARSFGTVNPCLATEAAWAAGGLNLYIYLTYGTTGRVADAGLCRRPRRRRLQLRLHRGRPTPSPRLPTPGSTPSVAWWLDVEGAQLVVDNRGQRRARPGGHRRPALRGPQQRRHLRQPGRLEPDRRHIPAGRALLGGRLGAQPGDNLPGHPLEAPVAAVRAGSHGPVQLRLADNTDKPVLGRRADTELRQRLRLLAPGDVRPVLQRHFVNSTLLRRPPAQANGTAKSQ